jgi:LCP family protein required for cell wall assembly
MESDVPIEARRAAADDATQRRERLSIAGPLAACLSFVWPGAGQAMLGARWRGFVLAVPQLLVAAGFGISLLAGPSQAAAWLVQPWLLLALVGMDLLVLATRVYAIADVGWRARLPGGSGRILAIGLLTALLAISVSVQGASASLGWSTYLTLTTVFSPEGPRGDAFPGSPTAQPTPSTTPRTTRTPRPSPTPSPTPAPTPEPDWAADGRLNLLLVGADAGPGRWKLRTDTMILLSVDVESGDAALIGIPRNIRNVPMPPPLDATFPAGFPDLLNALWVYVDENPGSFPGDTSVAPYAAVQAAAGTLTGVDIDAMAVAELQGFVRAVDALGGLDIDIPASVYDDRYPNPDGSGTVELFIPAGAQHLDGWHALAYARTRHQDGDYWRMERQQSVLVALQRQLRCDLLSRMTELLAVARDSLWVNLSLDDLPGIIELATRIDPDRLERLTLTPPTYPEYLDPAAVDQIRVAVRDILITSGPSDNPAGDRDDEADCS